MFSYSRPRSTSGIPDNIWLDNISSDRFDTSTLNFSGSWYNPAIFASYLKVYNIYSGYYKNTLTQKDAFLLQISLYVLPFHLQYISSWYLQQTDMSVIHNEEDVHMSLVITSLSFSWKLISKSLNHFILRPKPPSIDFISQSSICAYSFIADWSISLRSTSPPLFNLNGSGY